MCNSPRYNDVEHNKVFETGATEYSKATRGNWNEVWDNSTAADRRTRSTTWSRSPPATTCSAWRRSSCPQRLPLIENVNRTDPEIEMTKSTRNADKSWTPLETKSLKTLANENTPTRVIGFKLGRTEASIYSKAAETGVSLKPINQSPYGTKKK